MPKPATKIVYRPSILWSRIPLRKTSGVRKNMEFCTSAATISASNGSHVALSQHLLSLKGAVVRGVACTESWRRWRRSFSRGKTTTSSCCSRASPCPTATSSTDGRWGSTEATRSVKTAFHDTTPTRPTPRLHPYVRHVRFPRDDVGVGVVECSLKVK